MKAKDMVELNNKKRKLLTPENEVTLGLTIAISFSSSVFSYI
ncbi:hypothetical protein [Bacillus cereus group sp. BfR-BA-01380]|nr:hypothetical protein [Bacillus cereus group sp. BfR-BA-01380]